MSLGIAIIKLRNRRRGLLCQSGVWKTVGGVGNVSYQSIGNFTGGMNGANDNSNAELITAWGGGCPGNNGTFLVGSVNGFGVVAQEINNNMDYAKVSTIEFWVPAYTGYTIFSDIYACGAANSTFYVMATVFQ
ncbi:prepilin, shufflon protein A [Trinickia terrae]|uniref:Prepilin, shufflon protein A n=1 Tax=Trinickia terrae TaxID=2571161 RepID=A0A4V5PKZ9_9BURK|nr:prepilin, shufflon protein A [Trinickia terrae]TKC90140.1 prepilin, shufflon protein A [Trinickia terrae]